MAITFKQIGSINMELVLALKNKLDHAAGFPISDYVHDKGYNYDLSYGVHGINNKTSLKGTYVGTKYYCYNSKGWDGKKRIVHIHDPKNPTNAESFYVLVHTGDRDNSYGSCDLVTDIP